MVDQMRESKGEEGEKDPQNESLASKALTQFYKNTKGKILYSICYSREPNNKYVIEKSTQTCWDGSTDGFLKSL